MTMKSIITLTLIAISAMAFAQEQPVTTATTATAKPVAIMRPVTYLRTLTSRNRTLRAEMYDADQTDGDVVTVFYNNKPIISHFTLDHKRKRIFQIVLKKGMNSLVMQAENEGTTPPNTAALYLYNGKKLIRRLVLASDLKQSQGVKIKY